VNLGPVEPRNLGGGQSTKSCNGEVGNHRFTVAPFTAFLNGREAGIEQLAEFERVENFNLAAARLKASSYRLCLVFGSVFMCVAPSSHNYTLPIHQTEARSVQDGGGGGS